MSDALIDRLTEILGPSGLLTDPADTAPFAEDWRRLYRGRTAAVLRPASTEQVAAVLRECAAAGRKVVPQGGNTSMVGGAVPDEDGSELVLCLSRMNRIRDVDAIDLSLTIEAGATLKAAQMAADEAGCLFPLSIGSEGTSMPKDSVADSSTPGSVGCVRSVVESTPSSSRSGSER